MTAQPLDQAIEQARAVPRDRPDAGALDVFERGVEAVEVQEIRGPRHVEDSGCFGKREVLDGERVKILTAFRRHPVHNLQIEAVLDLPAQVGEARVIGAEQPLVSRRGQDIDREAVQVEIERAHALRPVDHEQRAMPVRQFAQRGQISPHARCVPHPIESQDARARSERPGDVVRVNITVARRKHRDPHAPPAQVKPREQIRWEVGARDHHLVARLEVEPGGRNADTLRGAVRQRDLLLLHRVRITVDE